MQSRITLQHKLALIATIKQYPKRSFSRLLSMTGVPSKKKYLFEWLLKNNMVKHIGKHFVCTAKGRKMLQVWEQLCKDLGENSNVM